MSFVVNMEKCEHYLFVSSNDSKNIHPNNNASEFWVELPTHLILRGQWEIALVEIKLSSTELNDYAMLFDGCECSYINDSFRPVLRFLESGTMHRIYNNPIYISVTRDMFERLHLILLPCDGIQSSLSTELLRCTLHLRRVK